VKFLSQLEPNLGALEPAYRQHFLPADVQQLMTIGRLYVLTMLAYLAIDFGLYGWTGKFWLLFVARVLVIVQMLWLMQRLKQRISVERFDALLLLASLVSFALGLLVHYVRATSSDYNFAVTVMLIVINYLVLPIPFVWRILTSVAFSLLEAGLTLWLKGASTEFYNALVALGLANLTGIVVSVRLYTFRRNQYKAQVEEQHARREIERLATTDALTGISNRRKWLEEATRVLARFLRTRQVFSVLYLDIDHFKKLNDTHGHAVGDVVLKHFAELVASHIRDLDLLGRFGGEEFVVLLPETNLENAKIIAGRIRAFTETSSLETQGKRLRLSVSIGVAEVALEDGNIEEVLHRADKALYKAKALGRNRVEALNAP
jgi:diguanylate cyclase